MKKILLAFMLLFSSVAYSQTNFYFYQGQKIYLNISNEKLLITFTQSASDEEKLQVLRNPFLRPFDLLKN